MFSPAATSSVAVWWGAASQARQGCGCCGGDQPVEPATELVGLGAELGDAAPEAAQCCFGGLGGIGEAVRVGPQPSAHGGGALEGPAGVELLTQRSRSSDEQIAESDTTRRHGP